MAPAAEHLTSCRLAVSDDTWAYATLNKSAIDAHWANAKEANPTYFDGQVFILSRWSVSDGCLIGAAVRTRFAAYLHWRDTGFDDEMRTAEAFATTVVVASDGAVLLARAVAGSLNSGHYVSPGGLIDESDQSIRGYLDPALTAARELYEETGLVASDMRRARGFELVRFDPYLAVASIYHAPVSGPELLSRIDRFLRAQPKPELEEPRLIYRRSDMDGMSVAPFTRLLTEAVLP